ncbi:MAG: tetratricopeptide repeat-containing glycosyltransferase family protein [Rhodospirillales bacterium]
MDETPATHHQILLQGQSALQRGDFREASRCFREVYAVAPDNLSAAVGLGLTVALSGDFQRGTDMLSVLFNHYPGEALVPESLGMVYADSGRYAEAETWYRKAMRLGGFKPSLVCSLGMVLNELARFDEAASMFKRCLRKNPEDISARYHLGLCQLLSGDYDAGWEGFQFRNRVVGRSEPEINAGLPRWDGQPLQGRSIVLLAEQGLGDTIQFARFATPLAAGGAKVFLFCDAALRDILGSIPGIAGVLTADDPLPDLDYQVAILDLPRILGIIPATIPCRDTYLTVPATVKAGAAGLLDEKAAKRRVGLVWAGNPNHKTDHKRSMPLQALSPVLGDPDTTFYSLQIGDARRQLQEIPEAIRPREIFQAPLPLFELAGVMVELDLLITVDTALAHLAGALGVPVWALISRVPDWRWMLDREDTDWYASMRLFRQTKIGDWSGVVDRVHARLPTVS